MCEFLSEFLSDFLCEFLCDFLGEFLCEFEVFFFIMNDNEKVASEITDTSFRLAKEKEERSD